MPKYIMLFFAMGLLSACGDSKQEQAANEPEVTVEAAAPESTQTPVVATEGEQNVTGVDASTLYASRCASCHGENADGVAGNPSLAALNRADIQRKLEIYRSGGSVGPKSAVMAPMARNLSDADIAALATYLGS